MIIEQIELVLLNINLNLSEFDHRKQMDFFIRELIFLSFIKSQKTDIVNLVETQIVGSNEIDTKLKDECDIRKRRVCKEKDYYDIVFSTALILSPIFMIFLLF